jgi:4-diphosphocytidyl-2-C-methyl-D-erythritol kinase
VPPAVPSIEEQLTPSKYGARQPGAGAPATELPAARPAGRRAATPATEPPAATAGSGKRTPRSRAAATTAAPAVPDAEAPAEAAPAGPIVRSAVAKLNLTLAVLHRRKDGYHALHSVMVPLALCDVLTVSVAVDRARAAGRDTLESAGFDAGAPADNLVLQAIAQTRAAVAETWPGAPEVPPPLNVRLEKKIPVAAGLGGGSSDAACAMDAALEAWDCGLTYQQAIWITATLGSDAPFFLAGGAALVTGRGEMVEPLPDLSGKPPAILLVTPCLRVSTTQVFEAYARGARPPFAGAARAVSEGLAESMRRGLSSQELIDHAADLAAANDLMLASVVVAPPLMAFRRSLARLLGHPLGQSGSGPTAWSLYSNVTEARKAATEVVRAYRAGALPEIGEGEPFVAVTTMLLRGDGRHAADHSPQGA